MRNNVPSRTATTIAFALSIFSAVNPHRKYLNESQVGMAEECLKLASPIAYKLAQLIKNTPIAVTLARHFEDMLLQPGSSMHFILRKKKLLDVVTRILKGESIDQLIVMAAGFDDLAYRMSKLFPEIQCFETDHPATQKVKVQAYANLNRNSPNLSLIAADYTKEPLLASLQKNPEFSLNKNTLIVAEGLFMYLEWDRVVENLSYIRQIKNTKSHFVFTHMNKTPDGRVRFEKQPWLIDFLLKVSKEPFIWGKSLEEIRKDLESRYFKVEEQLGSHDIAQVLGDDAGSLEVAKGELFCHIS
jgi:methyltransferase (TIGR00027 family)